MDDMVRVTRVALIATAEVGPKVASPCLALVPQVDDRLEAIRESAEKARDLGRPPAGAPLPTRVVRDDLAPLAGAFKECASPE
jgi:hypothetical protein